MEPSAEQNSHSSLPKSENGQVIEMEETVAPVGPISKENVIAEDDTMTSDLDLDNATYKCVCIYKNRFKLTRVCSRHRQAVRTCAALVFACLYFTYFSYALYLHGASDRTSSIIAFTVIVILVLLKKSIPRLGILAKLRSFIDKNPGVERNCKRVVAVLCLVTTIVTLVTEVALVQVTKLISLSGIAAIVIVFFFCSTAPHRVNWWPVVSGLILQYLFALAILRVPVIRSAFQWAGDLVSTIVSFPSDSSKFLFGSDYNPAAFAFYLLPLIVFVMAIMAMLEHLGILHAVLIRVGAFLAFCTEASAPESLNAVANIFMGPIDSVVLLRPFLDNLTPSELHCLMANGMATVTGSILGLYIMMGVSADNLLAASVMSAPAALALSKLAVPETQRRKNVETTSYVHASQYHSFMDAACTAAVSSLTVAGSIVANVTVVISFMAMVNYGLNWLGELVNFQGLSLQLISSYVFYPLALSLGTDVKDCFRVAEMLGIKVVVNELVAYQRLGEYVRNRAAFDSYVSNFTDWSLSSTSDDIFLPALNRTLKGGILSLRSEVITTFALCGFSNFISVGIIIGCYIALIPRLKDSVFKYVFRSMIVGHCASLLTACIAGLLY